MKGLLRQTLAIMGCIGLALGLSAPAIAFQSGNGEQHLIDSLQLGGSPQVLYLNAKGNPISYATFAQSLDQGGSYSLTRDRRAGKAMLRLRLPDGQPGPFAFKRGDIFPPFELPSLQRGTQRLGDFHGRYTLVSFFFADCVPCIVEVPTLNAYARGHSDMNFVAFTYEKADTARRFVRERGLTWDVLYDGQALTDTLGIGIYPTLMLIDPSGNVAGAAVGMSMQDDPAKRLADLTGWIEQWKRASTRITP